MNDTLQVILEAINSNQSIGIDLVNKVDSFYNNAWLKLLVFGSILFAIVGIFVPLVVQWYQKRTLKLSEEALRSTLKNDIRDELLETIEKKFSENKNEINLINASANAKILFSQAKFSVEKREYKGALGELVTSSHNSMKCQDYKLLQETLDFIQNNCLAYLSQEEINDLRTANICDLTSFLDELEGIDDRHMFQSKIGEIRVKISKLPKTTKEKPEETVKSVS